MRRTLGSETTSGEFLACAAWISAPQATDAKCRDAINDLAQSSAQSRSPESNSAATARPRTARDRAQQFSRSRIAVVSDQVQRGTNTRFVAQRALGQPFQHWARSGRL